MQNEPSSGLPSNVDHLPTRDGYNRWAAIYDNEDNPLIALEETQVAKLLGETAGLTIADIGCGTGRHALRLAAAGAHVTAVDFSEAMLAQAAAKPGANAVRWVRHDLADHLPFPNASFDRVLCCLVLDHIPDLADLLSECRRICRPDGFVLISVMHPAMMLRGLQARFTDPATGRETRPASCPHQVSDYVTAAIRAGCQIKHISEHAVDAELARRSPRAEKYLGWPMLLMMLLTAFFLALVLPALSTQAQPQSTRPAAATTAQAAPEDTADDATASNQEQLTFEWSPFPDDARFKVLGLPWSRENDPQLWRMPKARLDALPAGVKRRCKDPSGARILIHCNATRLAFKVTPSNKGASKGFDVYVNGKFLRSAVAEEPRVESQLVLFKNLDRRDKEIMVYLPYHQELTISSIGVDQGTKFSPPEHKFARPLPVVFYGSSVCQGSGASKPGMTYEAILCRELNLDFVNLGFGGAGKAEPAVVDLVNSIPACCYVFDLGKSYGMQGPAAFKNMLLAVRKSHPDVPIICITPITSALEVHDASYSARSIHTRTVMRTAVNELITAGDRKLLLVEGPDLLGFDEHDGLSKDGVHPSDQGYSIIARKLLPILKKSLAL